MILFLIISLIIVILAKEVKKYLKQNEEKLRQ
jgi:preprotein translocase subunit SecG